ncbi:hypothetical protein NMY22_g12078 [Coprinellus aureogranulatus]|nr:hypothetical protein NMY22_g12078 [Coprinellus aureogranulatus]
MSLKIYLASALDGKRRHNIPQSYLWLTVTTGMILAHRAIQRIEDRTPSQFMSYCSRSLQERLSILPKLKLRNGQNLDFLRFSVFAASERPPPEV